jgi:pimeloyl-ACP methyl ester carboxylesterase
VPTFGLLHGAWHGAWCWDRLLPELERRGARAVAVELPAADAAATMADYVDATLSALAAEPEPVVLVGHSLAGLVIPRVAAARPVSRLVYLCAFIPRPGASWFQQREEALTPGFASEALVDSDRCQVWPSTEIAAATLYPDCDAATAAWAVPRLRRQCYGLMRDVFEGRPDEAPAVSVLAKDDSVVRPEYSRRAARELLGAAAVEIEGGHNPHLARPAELAELLLRPA